MSEINIVECAWAAVVVEPQFDVKLQDCTKAPPKGELYAENNPTPF